MGIVANSLGNYYSSTNLPNQYLSPDDELTDNLFDYELGGIGLNDPSAGLEYQEWTCWWDYTNGNFYTDAPNQGSPTILFNYAGVTELSYTFDQNMNPFVAFVAGGQAKYWWYDTDIPGTTITDLDPAALTPRCCLDDKRDLQDATSDILLFYILNGNMYMRIQRERYLTEHLVLSPFVHPDTGQPAVLKKVGMHQLRRLQWTGVVSFGA